MDWKIILKKIGDVREVPWPDDDPHKTYENIKDAKKVADMLANHPDGFGDYHVIYVNEENSDEGYKVTDDTFGTFELLYTAQKK